MDRVFSLFPTTFLLVLVATACCSWSSVGSEHIAGSNAEPAAPVAEGVPAISPAEAAGYGVIQRVLGEEYTGKFKLCQITAKPGENDTFELRQSPAGLIELCGTNGVALAKGLYWYLRTYCNATVTWGHHGTGDHLELPSPLPAVPTTVRVSSSVKWRYYMNVCTVSYSSAWWDWRRWEREIDWMALHGINLPLSFTGQEYVIAEYYKSLGMTEEELQAYFSGPAFLAWNRMGNIRGWAGPLTPDNRKAQFMLQLQSLERMRALGMTPVLSGFSGHVPAALERIVPGIKLTESRAWGRFNATYTEVRLLDPTDKHFVPLAKGYYEMQTELMGTDHVYNVDTFNEMQPSSSNPHYLANTSAAVFQGMRAADPDAIWLMQGWLFLNEFWTAKTVKPYLDAVPNSGMIILDLYTEAAPIWSLYESYYGKPFIWCMLHNFGGRRSLCGNLTRIATGPASDRVRAGSSMAGIGLTPEAIEQNPVVYEMMLETGWTTQPIDVPSWISNYLYGRYGAAGGNTNLRAAWTQLEHAAYQYNFPQTYLGIVQKSPVIPRNRLEDDYAEPLDPSTLGYVNGLELGKGIKPVKNYSDYGFAGVTAAWRLMVQGAVETQASAGAISGPLSYDLVDVGRQVLAAVHDDLVTLSSAAFLRWSKQKTNSSADLARIGKALLTIVKDLDQLLSTDTNYLLGHWLDTAKDWATDDAERKQFEANARYQITLWGPSGQINDYAEKHWAGLVGTYYYGRWNLWQKTLQTAVDTGVAVDVPRFQSTLLAWEQSWCQANGSYTTVPAPGAVSLSQRLLSTWATASTSGKYERVNNTNVIGFDIHAGRALLSKDIGQMKMFCDLEPLCVGFLSTGYLKTALTKRSAHPNCDLYVKQPQT
ncbi:alpha-N-acetylglucosaminidase-like [Sycon ciliatum]|uniref:alpha-N-acetylglucosaminidase-like n=1 Tax=Sycon ciliatum TaxID=27933 RepID=UPI0031F68FD4